MPVDVQWGNIHQTVLICRFIQDWHWGEYRVGLQKGLHLIAGVDHPVHVIVDLRWGRRIPVGAFNQLRPALSKLPANLGLLVFVGADDIAMTIGKVLRRQYPRALSTVHSLETIEEAYILIQQTQSVESS